MNKKEVVNRRAWPTRRELEYIEASDNAVPRHSTLGMRSTVDFENGTLSAPARPRCFAARILADQDQQLVPAKPNCVRRSGGVHCASASTTCSAARSCGTTAARLHAQSRRGSSAPRPCTTMAARLHALSRSDLPLKPGVRRQANDALGARAEPPWRRVAAFIYERAFLFCRREHGRCVAGRRRSDAAGGIPVAFRRRWRAGVGVPAGGRAAARVAERRTPRRPALRGGAAGAGAWSVARWSVGLGRGFTCRARRCCAWRPCGTRRG
jgi:hypothetical protein